MCTLGDPITSSLHDPRPVSLGCCPFHYTSHTCVMSSLFTCLLGIFFVYRKTILLKLPCLRMRVGVDPPEMPVPTSSDIPSVHLASHGGCHRLKTFTINR
eukprot:TRINITY_DN76589_c0_g1_i1.p1 TRINITY_DN76589_c0_g1~~TRINITY_DN76589_c0_g1_i1.p1  ORF type:complete len:100 (-),score=6.37 TRINITY_DN76589_c0_g1_i1:200-499(-)